MGYFPSLAICVSWLMPGDWMVTNQILCQQNYKKEASEQRDTNWQHHAAESLCVWTPGVRQSGGKNWVTATYFSYYYNPASPNPLWEWLNWSASAMAGYETVAIWVLCWKKELGKVCYETQWVTRYDHENSQDYRFDPFYFCQPAEEKQRFGFFLFIFISLFFFTTFCSVAVLEHKARRGIHSLRTVMSNVSEGFDHQFHDETFKKKAI